jgi:beta-lactam-binding protein with PASTA domain
LAVAVAVLLLGAACTADHKVTVPGTVGLAYSTAEARLREARLAVKRVETRTDSNGPGTVVRTVPGKSARVDPGTVVTVYVAIPPLVTVPSMLDVKYSVARAKLEQLGLTVERIDDPTSTANPGTVTGVAPKEGTAIEVGTSVALDVATGVRLPVTKGLTWGQAQTILQVAGVSAPFTVYEDSIARESGVVVAMKPRGHTWVARGSFVELLVAKPPPCDPHYLGACLEPNASDYDCWPGTGNGPLYVFVQVRVVGSDPYGLDGYPYNGIGCQDLPFAPLP